jgi:hypothetical protein
LTYGLKYGSLINVKQKTKNFTPMNTKQEQSTLSSELDRKVGVINEGGLFDAKPVGHDTLSAISIMGQHEALAGNILRRLCKLGGEACAQTCAIHQGLAERSEHNLDKKCADANLSEVVAKLGLRPENVLMVGVTGKREENRIGFADEVDANIEKYKFSISPVTDIKELPGFNSFFAAEDDSVAGNEIYALGRRLADCGDINIEYTNKEGRKIMGFMHMTRTNLEGEGHHQNRRPGVPFDEPSYRFFMQSAFDHYGLPDEQGIDVRISAAIKQEHFEYKFDTQQKMDELFPGWENNETVFTPYKQFIKNSTDPTWKYGDDFEPTDKFQVDFRGMLEWQIRRFDPVVDQTRVNGKPLRGQEIDWEGVIDPGDSSSSHASNARGKKDQDKDGRDAYLTIWAKRINPNS